jgi:putative oxidoreductase
MKTTGIKSTAVVNWAARIIGALIMLQTLYFKFSGAEESIYIFTTVGIEPFGRYATGVLELVAAILLLVPATSWLGAALGAGLMAGAVGMHLTLLGISVQGDGGYLFFLAVAVLLCCLLILYLEKSKWLKYIPVKKAQGIT